MHTLRQTLSQALVDAYALAFPDHDQWRDQVLASLTYSTQAQFGHYQCNVAMRLANPLQLSPRDIATSIVSNLDAELFEKVEVAGPGFINLWLQPSLLSAVGQLQLNDQRLGVVPSTVPQKIVVDFSSPNIAKEMHVGHLRSTIIGDCVANIFSFCGDDVLRLNHIGDWGTAFGMLIVYLSEREPAVLTGEKATDLSHLVVWYKAAKQLFDNDPEFKKRAQLQVVRLQQGDADALAAWQLICAISRLGFQIIYDLLNVTIQERGESYYNDQLNTIITLLDAANLITISNGAKCVFLEGFLNRDNQPLPLIVQKSDGGFNYASTDLAALYHRVHEEHADRIIYLTDSGQSQHFQQVFATAEKAGFFDPSKTQVQHAGFGLVLGEDGKKFKTRSGTTIRLQDLLNEAISRAHDILISRDVSWTTEEVKTAARVLGIAAVKYADLSNSRISDYQFSFDRMLQFEGNTATFILYAYVRVQSIQKKVGLDEDQLSAASLSYQHPSEIALGLQLARFTDVIEKIKQDLMPHSLTDYLYETAQKFNVFFRDCRVSGSDREAQRWLICELTARVIKTGLGLLGIETLDRM